MPTTRAMAAAEAHEEDKSKSDSEAKRQKPPSSHSIGGEPPKKRARVRKSPDRNGTIKETGSSLTEKPIDELKDFHKRHGILERGHIYFFYRPKVGLEESHDIEDVSKFHFLLIPRPDIEGKFSTDAAAAPAPAPRDLPKERFRYIAVGKKRLPDTEAKHEVFWATVINYGDNLEGIKNGLKEQIYQTKTRGERHVQPARPAGRGVYTIMSPRDESLPPSKRNQTYLAYLLSHPSSPEEVQSELGIQHSSSLVLQVKNPDAPSAPQAGLNPEKKANYPPEGKHEAFGKGVGARKFVPANPTTLLDYTGAELLLIGDKRQVEDVIGEEPAKDLERVADEDAHTLSTEEVMRELLLDAKTFPPDALEGKWI